MAFIQSASILPTKNKSSSTCMKKTSNRHVFTMSLSRRSMLRLIALSVAMPATNAVFAAVNKPDDDFDLKELKKDVEELQYEDEVLDVGPDDREKNPTRIKKKVKEPAYVAEEKKLVEDEDNNYEKMVAKERDESAKIRAKFSKK